MLSAGSFNVIAFKPTVTPFHVNRLTTRHLQQSAAPDSHSLDALHNEHVATGQQLHDDVASQFQRRSLLQSSMFTFMAASLPAIAADDTTLNCAPGFAISDKVFFDIAIDREPVGRIVVGLFNDAVPLGAKRFAEIAVGSRGVSYRKKEFEKITPFYIQNAGIRNFSLSGGVRDAAQFTGGETTAALIPELEELNRTCPKSTKNVAGTVSIVVKDPEKPPPKTKLIAKDGKFEVIEEELRPDPNGTQFSIITQDSPQLDASYLAVGKIIDGFDVIKLINNVRVVKDNTGSPYFKAAKLVGDTRAVVAERGFNRPYSKIVILRSGKLES